MPYRTTRFLTLCSYDTAENQFKKKCLVASLSERFQNSPTDGASRTRYSNQSGPRSGARARVSNARPIHFIARLFCSPNPIPFLYPRIIDKGPVGPKLKMLFRDEKNRLQLLYRFLTFTVFLFESNYGRVRKWADMYFVILVFETDWRVFVYYFNHCRKKPLLWRLLKEMWNWFLKVTPKWLNLWS